MVELLNHGGFDGDGEGGGDGATVKSWRLCPERDKLKAFIPSFSFSKSDQIPNRLCNQKGALSHSKRDQKKMKKKKKGQEEKKKERKRK